MIINDEMLCAYLDNELSAQDRALVQASLRQDATTSDRLSQLASVDALIGKQAALIDSQPMPESVMNLLRENNAQSASGNSSSDNIVDLSRFRQTRQRVMLLVREHAVLAASLALLIGLAGGQMLSSTGGDGNSNASLYAALDTAPSGQQFDLDTNIKVTPRFSFQDTQSRFCRQFMVQDSQGSSENIACRDRDQWTLVASARSSAVASSAQYQPASGPRLLDNMLDAMMQGSALSQTDEQAAINNQWQAE